METAQRTEKEKYKRLFTYSRVIVFRTNFSNFLIHGRAIRQHTFKT